MFGDVQAVLDPIQPTDRVLDVGGWACPFNRADWILDSEPYETRGFYATIGLPASQGGAKEHFTKETWVQRDICAHEPWPFADKFFDFAICSHTLEDIRDPLAVCAELIRVSKAGYIEVPSRLIETCRGAEDSRLAGLSHHRWLIEIADQHIQFTPKYHMIHGDIELSLPVGFEAKIPAAQRIAQLTWSDRFTFAETKLDGLPVIRRHLADYVSKHYRHPAYRLAFAGVQRNVADLWPRIRRRLTKFA